jgi:PAS domain S-box-containing protein
VDALPEWSKWKRTSPIGEVSFFVGDPGDIGYRICQLEKHAFPFEVKEQEQCVMNDEEKTKAQLIEELAALRQQASEQRSTEGESRCPKHREILRKVQRRLHDAVATMESSDDIKDVLSVLKEGLHELEISFQDCGINLVDPHQVPAVGSINSLGREGEWLPFQKMWGHDLVYQFWKAGVPVYRRDLQAEDLYDERHYYPEHFGHSVRCVLDIPFAFGTLAVNSEKPDAFSQEDISDLEHLTIVLEEGFRRGEDLQSLERRNRELDEKDRLLVAFQQIAQTALSSLDLDQILDHLTTQITQAGIFRSLVISLVDEKARQVTQVRSVFRSVSEHTLQSDPDEIGISYSLDDKDILAETARTGEFQVGIEWDDRLTKKPNQDLMSGRKGQVAYFIPVKREDRVLAVLATGSMIEEKETMLHQVQVMQPLLDQIAIALEHARLYEEIQKEIKDRTLAERTLQARLCQQAVVAELGQYALADSEIIDLMDLTVARIAETLNVEYCKVLQWLPDDDIMLLRAGVGWKEGLVGRANVPAGQDSQAGYTLLSSEPVIVEDLKTETRFSGPALLHDHGVVSGMSVIIQGHETPWGVLGVHTTESRDFSYDDINFIQALAHVLAEAITRKQVEAELQRVAGQWSATFDSMPDLIAIIDDQHRIVRLNQAMAKRLGTTPQEAEGLICYECVHGLSEPPDFCPHARLLEDEQEHTEEVHELRLGGDFLVSVNPMRDEFGRLVGSVHVARDITQRKQAEENTRLDLALQYTRNVVLQMQRERDWEKVILIVQETLKEFVPFNACSVNLVSLPENRLTAYAIGPWKGLHQNVRESIQPAIKRALETGQYVYRPNRADPLFTGPIPSEIHSVIDVPFIGGTLAINSTEEDAFTQRDIEILERFSQVISEACRRRDDLGALEHRNRELEVEITERKQAEERMVRQSRVLDAVNQVLRESLRCDTREEVARTCLKVAEELTDSRFGFIGELNQAGLFDTTAISNPGWDACSMPDSDATKLITDMPIRGVALSMLREEKSRIVNDPVSHPDHVTLPEGHPQITAFLGVPLKREGKTVGMIGLANKESGYTLADQENVESLGGAFVEALNHQRTAEALRKGEERYRLMVERLPIGITHNTPAGEFLVYNPFAQNLTGYTLQELSDMKAQDLYVHPEDRDDLLSNLREKGEHSFEYPLRRKDGRVIWVRGTTRAIKDAEGRLIELQGFSEDITERKQMEEERIHTQRLRAVSELAAGVSHNLNNMLTGVLGPAQLLERYSDDPRVLQEAEEIIAGARRARDLVQRLNLAARGADETERVPVPVNQIIRDAIQAARPRWKDEAEARGIAIEVATNLGDVPTVRGTGTGLHDILLNLLFNAVDAMPEGGTLTIDTQSVDDGVRLTVRDTGIGMEEETKRRVFEPLFTTKMDVGSGLGLATVHSMVESWGGHIEVESAPGQGTTFTLWLRVWDGPEIPSQDTEVVEGSSMRRCRLLVIDDDENVCRLLESLLSDRHEVEIVSDGQEGLERFSPGRFDVILIDLGLPGMSGDRVAREMKRVDPAVVSVLITGWVMRPDDVRLGVFDFQIPKPFDDLDEVEEVVVQAIELHDERVVQSD